MKSCKTDFVVFWHNSTQLLGIAKDSWYFPCGVFMTCFLLYKQVIGVLYLLINWESMEKVEFS